MSTAVHNAALVPLGPVGPSQPAGVLDARSATGSARASGPSFSQLLAARTSGGEPPRFSRHALERLQQRGIELNPSTLDRLTGGVARAAGKGSRDSVVFLDGTAYVVSVANNTVITAVAPEHMREHVFTNIDSAVIA